MNYFVEESLGTVKKRAGRLLRERVSKQTTPGRTCRDRARKSSVLQLASSSVCFLFSFDRLFVIRKPP